MQKAKSEPAATGLIPVKPSKKCPALTAKFNLPRFSHNVLFASVITSRQNSLSYRLRSQKTFQQKLLPSCFLTCATSSSDPVIATMISSTPFSPNIACPQSHGP